MLKGFLKKSPNGKGCSGGKANALRRQHITVKDDISPATIADIDSLLNLSTLANWNQLDQDWVRLLRFHPAGCLRMGVCGKVVASSTLMPYRDNGAWLGMVLVHPDNRGKGYGKAIVAATLELAEKLGFFWVGLDATDAGRAVYRDLGFADCFPVKRWRRPGNGKCSGIQKHSFSQKGTFLRHDPGHFESKSADYRWIEHLLQENGTSLLTRSRSYALLRPGREAWHVGPVKSGTAKDFAHLLDGVGSLCGGDQIYLDCYSHPELHRALESTGFEPFRHLTRMVLGRTALPKPKAPWEIFKGFEWG